jgi:hypothetical protein
MPKLSSITRPTLVTETFDVHGEPVSVTFDRSKITMHWTRFMQEDENRLPEALAAVVHEWDITNDDGTAFDPTVENICELPLPVVNALCVALGDSKQPSEDERKNSLGPPSSQSVASTEQAEMSPNGPATSRSPVS